MSFYNTDICTEKQYLLIKKFWNKQTDGIQSFKEIIAPNGVIVPMEKIKKSEAKMIIGCMLSK
ncbi:hypothetical protein [Spiroplasma sp. SV19]|uniref:hypothetical protein n=1 Tax=Spiroplasma sp. SV19 TaxID=2570468 RepID=UPI0024B8181E|nr:hypothetical protein [Spiroplasma sp. SV19]WHQ37091.1 hypothetical protein E7Y35_04245 [Spiroplasma sp. SV19]